MPDEPEPWASKSSPGKSPLLAPQIHVQFSNRHPLVRKRSIKCACVGRTNSVRLSLRGAFFCFCWINKTNQRQYICEKKSARQPQHKSHAYSVIIAESGFVSRSASPLVEKVRRLFFSVRKNFKNGRTDFLRISAIPRRFFQRAGAVGREPYGAATIRSALPTHIDGLLLIYECSPGGDRAPR